MWNCRCQCGNFSQVPGTDLRLGRTKSCGCYSAERMREYNERRKNS